MTSVCGDDENASFSLVSSRHDGLLLLRLAFSQRVAEMHFLRLPLQKRNLYSADLTRLYTGRGEGGQLGGGRGVLGNKS